ncbi:carboxypeptidase-like regulatory domain-containing protein [Dyadobacter sandarakinus]|uniref:Carboxypeptidase-like regulatory domain-containing protein n=1 Tax=Dyadobacter sandarakinus TaxID=2747268 RepID=A0ABX7IED0_9BACT|nr:carboxypeptidase-like regulatory domain-containing protein [Dyadobacter sandarakinus]QRR04178.1 carboxypeptidase-like regulatory domain-containing protein [Dyadobacter sandarakinus]
MFRFPLLVDIRFYKSAALWLILLLLATSTFAQETGVILAGKVTDGKTGKPLPFANVFVNNSSIGTNADENGNYRLPGLSIGSIEIAVSFLGYETVRQTLRFEQPGLKTVMFKLVEGMELKGVTVYAKKNKKRERNLKIITRELLGNSRFTKQCNIVNPEALRISEDDNGHLSAQTTKPLIIENHALGYRIHQDLDDFDFYQGKVYYGGSTRFELLVPKDSLQKKLWRANQKIAYQGSLKHLLASMVADSLIEQGFKVYQVIPDSLRLFKSVRTTNGVNLLSNHLHNRIEAVRGARLIVPGELITERLVVSRTQLEVFNTKKRTGSPYDDMPFAYSQISFPQGYMVITPQGWVSMPMGMEIAGDLGNDRFSTLLPADWKRDD